jgi:hypothetical protein
MTKKLEDEYYIVNGVKRKTFYWSGLTIKAGIASK